MKVPMKWLAEFIDTGLAPAELAHKMTMAGLEAEKIEEIGSMWDNVYVGYVHAVTKHPDADRLVLANVEAGPHRLTVVTGAPNIRQGQIVPLALAGARLIDGHSDSGELKTLKPGMIRGVKSEGMVCSEKELGLSDEHEGIMVLPADAPVGAPLKDYLGDTVIEFEITPNLVHAFSIQGIAREAGAVTGRTITQPAKVDLATLPSGADDLVTIESGDICARYAAVVFEGVTVGPSPEWLVRRLNAAGLRSISNIVDITNYVMHEIGQPLHAFDYDKLSGLRIVVRRAHAGERMETLDHVDRALSSDMMVIADAERPVAVAGIIGGFESEVSDETTTILLEGANFNMASVRQTARVLGLRTDASARFERGIDQNLVGDAMSRATRLILELCPGARVVAMRDVYPRPAATRTLELPVRRISALLGIAYEDAEIIDALGRLGFAPAISGSGDDRRLTVTIPTYRGDVTIPEDVIEEVARIIGYDRLPSTLPSGVLPAPKRDEAYSFRKAMREILIGSGAHEAVTYVTQSEGDLAHFASDEGAGFVRRAPLNDLLRVKNPLQSGVDLLRPTLLPSLLHSVSANLRHQESVRLFETARAYLPSVSELPDEVELLTIALAGRREPLGLRASQAQIDYLDAKGIVDELIARMGIDAAIHAELAPGLHPGRAAAIRSGDDLIGRLGELHPRVASAFGIEDVRVAVVEIDLSLALRLAQQATGRRDAKVPRFLPAEQDFAIVVNQSVAADDVRAALSDGAGPLVSAITLFDVYEGEQIGEGKKSLAFRVTFTAPDRALTDDDLVKYRVKIEKTLKQRVGGVLRA